MSKAKKSEQKEKKQLKNVQEQSSNQTQQGNNKLELDIRINRIVNKDNLRAMASVNFNKCYAIKALVSFATASNCILPQFKLGVDLALSIAFCTFCLSKWFICCIFACKLSMYSALHLGFF